MVAFVTGASGHLGNVLVRSLLDRGHIVRVLLRRANPPALEGLEVEPIHGDLFDHDALRRGCAGAHWVFHCAAMISTTNHGSKTVERVNVIGTRNMVEAAIESQVDRFIYVGSVEALDLTRPDETVKGNHFCPERSVTGYGRTKAKASLEVLSAVRERGLSGIIGIPSALIGPFDFGTSRTVEMVRRFLRGRLPAYIDGGFDFVDVRDVAEGLLAAAQDGRIGESYLLTGELLSYYQITETLERLSGVRMSRLKTPYWLALLFTCIATGLAALIGRAPLYTPNSLRILQTRPIFDRERSIADLGYRPRPIADTLADTISWVEGRFMKVTKERG